MIAQAVFAYAGPTLALKRATSTMVNSANILILILTISTIANAIAHITPVQAPIGVQTLHCIIDAIGNKKITCKKTPVDPTPIDIPKSLLRTNKQK